MKKKQLRIAIVVALIILILSIAIVIGTVLKKSKEETKDNNENYQKEDIQEVLKNETEENQKGINLSNITINNSGSRIIVSGEVSSEENLDNVSLELLLYANKRLGGTTSTVVDLVDKKGTFELMIVGDYSNLDTYKVVVLE